MRKFEKDNLIQFIARFYTFAGKLIDLDSFSFPSITIKNAVGTSTETGLMIKKSTGSYFYLWTPDTADKYLVEISGIVQGKTSLIRKVFRVVETS